MAPTAFRSKHVEEVPLQETIAPATHEEIIPWGRSFDEYRRMFALDHHDLHSRILGCADGPASFNAELTGAAGFVVSLDPIYEFSAEQIRQRVQVSAARITEYARQNKTEFKWSPQIPNPEALASHRLATMETFLEDFDGGRERGRYVAGELPNLPFENDEFDLAVCSHFLFLYSQQLSWEFHLTAIRNLARVSSEVRIFPLVDLRARPSRHVATLAEKLIEEGLQLSIEKVDYEFQRGGNQMLRIIK